MLKLSRKVGEAIKIGNDIEVTFLRKKRGKEIVLGVDAPKDVKILRKEVTKKNEEISS